MLFLQAVLFFEVMGLVRAYLKTKIRAKNYKK